MTEPESPPDRRWPDALRAQPPAPAESRARVLARLEAVIPEMKRGPGGGNGGGGGGTSHGASALRSRAIAVTAFLLGGVSGAALYATLGPGPGARMVTLERPAPASPEAARPVTSAAVAQATAEVQSSAPPPLPGSSSTSARPVSPARSHAESGRPAPPPGTSQLAAERMLLDEARAGLVQGEPARALDRLEQHRRRYRAGMLAEERDAMSVEALVGLKRYDSARSAAEAFRGRTPRSMFLPTVESAIASIP